LAQEQGYSIKKGEKNVSGYFKTIWIGHLGNGDSVFNAVNSGFVLCVSGPVRILLPAA